MIIAMICLLFGCVAPDKNVTERPCRLCGYQGLQGNDRLGILLISSGRTMEIGLPPYKSAEIFGTDGETGFSMSTGKAAQGMNRVTVIVHPGEGKARVSAEIQKRARPDEVALKKLYCRDCIQKIKKIRTDILLVDLQERSVYPIDRSGMVVVRGYEVVWGNQEDRAVLEISYEARRGF